MFAEVFSLENDAVERLKIAINTYTENQRKVSGFRYEKENRDKD
jgi:hypothetical protein